MEGLVESVKSKKSGYTLIEIMIAACVLALAILTTAFSITNLQNLGELARQKEIAVNDANHVLETMRQTADNSLTSLRSTDWSTWLTNNVINLKTQNELRLDQETMTVTVGNADPAAVSLVLNWNHKQRTYSYRVRTLMTNRE